MTFRQYILIIFCDALPFPLPLPCVWHFCFWLNVLTNTGWIALKMYYRPSSSSPVPLLQCISSDCTNEKHFSMRMSCLCASKMDRTILNNYCLNIFYKKDQWTASCTLVYSLISCQSSFDVYTFSLHQRALCDGFCTWMA